MRNHIIRSILLVLLASQCSDRERLNPIDPRNPVTGGKPAGLTLSSDKRAVFARWDHIDNKSVTGYHLWRKREDQEEFVLVAALSGDSTNWSDSITHYDSSYAYEISATTTTWETPKSDPETIIPGPFNYWIADFFAGLLRRISYDGAHLLFEDYADSPVSIQMAQSQRSLWLASSYPARIRRLTVDGILEFSRALPASPVDLAVDGISGDVFIAMLGSPDVVRLDSTGGERDVLPCKVTFTLGTELAVDPLKK
ncbi:MAG: hypothetical protein ACE5GH_02495, partial [Fidelibacterota bacterium]